METHCFKTFCNSTEKNWGIMFYNPNLPERHDANHAEVINPVNNPFTITKEVSDFYHQKNLPARINFYDPDKNHPFKKILEKEEFKCLDTNILTTFMVLNTKTNQNEVIENQSNFQVSLTSNIDSDSIIANDITKVLHSDLSYENLVTNNDYYYFILYDGGEAVSVLSYFLYSDFKLARLDDVVTLPTKHNNGYTTLLLKYASNWVQNKDYTPYLLANNEIDKNVYSKVGFEEIFTCQKIHWIKEIEE